MLRPPNVWAGLLAAGLAYEAYGLTGGRAGYTLSEVTRELFRTSHPVGKTVFLGIYLGFSAWFVPHIVVMAAEAAADVIAAEALAE